MTEVQASVSQSSILGRTCHATWHKLVLKVEMGLDAGDVTKFVAS